MENRVLWIIDHYASEPKYGGYTRQYSLAKELSQLGVSVVVIASSFSHFSHEYISEKDYIINEIAPGAHIIYFKTSSYEKNSGVQRLFGMYSFLTAISKYTDCIEKQFGKPNWVVASSPHIYSWVAGERIARKYKASYNIEIRDFWPLELRSDDDDYLHKLLYKYFDHLETKAFNHANKIICTMENGRNYCDDMKKKGKEKFVYIGQPLDCDRYDEEASKNYENIPKEIREFVANDFYCVFSGYYMPYEGVSLMLEAAKELPKVKFVFVGSGKEENNMRRMVSEKELTNVLIWTRIKKECIPALLKHSAICLAYLYDENNPDMFKYGMSKNKVNEYLYSGAITIMGFNIEENEIVKSGGGFTFMPESNQFAKYIKKVLNMSPQERLVMGEEARKYMRQEHGTSELARKYVKYVLSE